MKKTILSILSLNLLGFAVYFYANMGSFEYVGNYEKFPIYVWRPTPIAVVVSLFAIFLAGVIYYFSVRPTRIKYRVAYVLSFGILFIPLIITRVFNRSFNLINIQRTPIGTDSLELQFQAAKSIVRGVNPYKVDYMRELLSHVNWSAYTWIYSGKPYVASNIIGFVTRFDYLPQAAVYYLPAALFGIPPNMWNIIVFSVFIVLFFLRIRELYSGLYIAILSAGMFIYFFEPIRYTPDTGWLVPLLIAVMLPKHPRLSGFLLGFAAAYRSYVALLLPFYFIMLYKEGYEWRKTLLWAAVPNVLIILPFFLVDPGAFMSNVLIPYVSNFSPFDSIAPGVIMLHYVGIDVSPVFLKVLIAIMFCIAIPISYRYYEKLREFLFFVPTMIMLLYPRPSYVYYIYFPFVGVVAYVTGFFSMSYPSHKNFSESVKAAVDRFFTPRTVRKDHSKLSTSMLATSIIGLMLLLDFAYGFLYMRIIVTVILLVLPFLALLLARKAHFGPRFVLAAVVSLLFVGGFVLASANNVYYIVHDYRYAGDYYWLTVYAAEDILHLKNPYLEHYMKRLENEKFFGKSIIVKKASYCPIIPEKMEFRYGPDEGFTKYVENGSIKIIDFYDYPPLLAVFTALSIAIGLPPIGLHYIVYVLSLILLLYRVKSEIGRTAIVTVLVGSYVLSTFAYSVFSNSVLYVAFLILMMTFVDRPKVSGVFAGLAFMTMPQAALFILFWLVFVMYKTNLKSFIQSRWFREFAAGAVISSIIVVTPFIMSDPITVLKRMFFPIVGNLLNNEYNGVGIGNILTTEFGLPTRMFTIIGVILVVVLLVLYYTRRRSFVEIGLLLPVYVFMFFPRTIITYVSFYFLLTFVAWVTRRFGIMKNIT